jgi:hypothetical protein
VLEVAVLLAAVAAVGAIRPRWSTLLVALVPAGLAFLWLLGQEDVPGDELTAGDLGWFGGMSAVAGAAFAAACALGVITGRALRRSHQR